MKTACFYRFAILATAMALFTGSPVRAATYNAVFQTVDQTNGFDFNLTLTGDGSNNLVGASGFITGLGTSAGYSGAVTGFLLPGSNSNWNWDNKIFATAPFFTPSGCCSGIVLTFNTASFGADIVNLYTDGSGTNDYASFLNPNGDYNPGLLINLATVQITATPLPTAGSMFVGGILAFAMLLGGQYWKRRSDAPTLAAA